MTDKKQRDGECKRWVEEIYRPWYEANVAAFSGGNSPPPPPPGG